MRSWMSFEKFKDKILQETKSLIEDTIYKTWQMYKNINLRKHP